MWIFPVLLDSRPAFLPPGDGGSLLLAPLGTGTVLDRLRACLGVVSKASPVVLTRFAADPDYQRQVREACPDVERVETVESFTKRYSTYQPSDWLLIADPACIPLDSLDPALLELGRDGDTAWVKHLVALDAGGHGTKEVVETDPDGRVRGVRRYYDSVTWPLASGVSCSLVSMACLLLSRDLSLTSLPDLRRALAARGVPSRDVPLEKGALDLGRERGLLNLNERLILDLVRERGHAYASRTPLHVGRDTSIHPSLRTFGPVVFQDGALVEEGATLIGPAVIGPGARIGRDALIAQSLIGRDQQIAAGATIRHRALLDGHAPHSPGATVEGAPHGEDGPAPEAWDAALLRLPTEHPLRSHYPALKRALDVVASALGLIVLLPFGLLIAALIKLESRGPVFFGHLREGLRGRPFRCWKFRTMIVGADAQQRVLAQENEVDGPQFKVHHDPRYTRLGRFLSTTTLDELPQLFNVLVGQMSLVGPRPSPFRENQLCVPWREARLSVRPGMTGLWQVCRHDRHKGDFHQWIYYDLLYVQHGSLGLDLKLILATPLFLGGKHPAPLHRLLPPETYHERRAAPRQA